MNVLTNISLKPFNTFGLDVKAKAVIPVCHENNIFEVLLQEMKPIMILGGGSNVLLTGDVDGFVLKNEIKGIEVVDEDENQLIVRAGAGEIWHQLVMWSLSHRLGGLENLALIPGSVGAAPIQNIGAYGVEQEKCFHSLQAIDLNNGVRRTFYKDDCKFGYRESIFKTEAKDRYFITHVSYVLTKKGHVLNLDYGAIKEKLAEKSIFNPEIRDVAEAVMDIRSSKLPDPRVIGNAGSFFKNPVIDINTFNKLKSQFPDIPAYTAGPHEMKIAAGWLIEKAGFKGQTFGNIGVHKQQALVLVNYGGGQGKDIYDLALKIQDKVKATFNIEITPEVNIW